MSDHFIRRCVCGRLLSQCRCPGPKHEFVQSPCHCPKPEPLKVNGLEITKDIQGAIRGGARGGLIVVEEDRIWWANSDQVLDAVRKALMSGGEYEVHMSVAP